MSVLIFDTETTGFPSNNLPANHPAQAHIVQLACLLLDNNLQEVGSFVTLIKPNGWKISAGAAAVHKKTNEMCERYGINIADAADMLQALGANAKLAVAHNIKFDRQMVAIDAPLSLPNIKNDICTMDLTTDLCKLPHPSRSGWKWPKLQEACMKLLNIDITVGAHDALVDCRACASLYRYLIEKDYIKLAA